MTIHKRIDVRERELLHTPIRLWIVALVAELSLLEDRHWETGRGTLPRTVPHTAIVILPYLRYGNSQSILREYFEN